jgi:hypothetical protein
MIHLTFLGVLKASLIALLAWAVRDEYKNSSYEIKYKHPEKEESGNADNDEGG